jgi:hypothetical protein
MFHFVEVFGKKLESSEFSDLRFSQTIFTLQTSFKPLLLKGGTGGGGGIKTVSKGDCE